LDRDNSLMNTTAGARNLGLIRLMLKSTGIRHFVTKLPSIEFAMESYLII
jgi:hypothetical protein